MISSAIRPGLSRAIAPALAIIGPPQAAQAPTAPTLADIADYQTNSTTWIGIPWGPESWEEDTIPGQPVLYQVLDVYLPPGTAPAGGWPVVCWYHANSNTRDVGASGVLADAKAAIHAAGLAFIAVEFRHPVSNVRYGAPHEDVGRSVQFARGLATALDLDITNFFALSRSRGSLCIWQALQPDLAIVDAPTWAGRQSSLLKGIWAYNAQTTYDSEEFANLFVIPEERDDFLVLRPNDPRWGSALASVPTAPQLPAITMLHETAYPTGLVSAAAANDVHYAGMGSAFRDAYIAEGAGALIDAQDSVPTSDVYLGSAAWFASLVS